MLNSQLAFTCTVCYFILEPVQLLHCSNNSTKENKGFRYAGRAKQGPATTFLRGRLRMALDDGAPRARTGTSPVRTYPVNSVRKKHRPGIRDSRPVQMCSHLPIRRTGLANVIGNQSSIGKFRCDVGEDSVQRKAVAGAALAFVLRSRRIGKEIR